MTKYCTVITVSSVILSIVIYFFYNTYLSKQVYSYLRKQDFSSIALNNHKIHIYEKKPVSNPILLSGKSIQIRSRCNCHKDQITMKTDNISFTIEYGKVKYNLSMNDFDLDASTCDMYSVLSRGPNQKVIGYTLYGNNTERYYKQLDLISDQAAFHYPEWTIRIYYDDTALQDYLCDISCRKRNVVLCYASQIPYGSIDNRTWSAMYINKMMWRWLPTGDPFVDYFMSRDADSWIIEREAQSTDEWLKSNNIFHIMRGELRSSSFLPIFCS
jgi:hypothetical protein